VSTADPEGQDSAPDPASEAAPSPSSADLPAPGVMLAKEQQTGYLTAGAVGVIVVILGVSRQIHNSHSDALATAALGVAGAVALAYAVHRGKRIFAAIVSIVGGLALSGFFPLNFIFLAYGGYLMFLQSRAQKRLNKAGVRRTRPPPKTRKDGTTRGRRGAPPPATNRPKANRRYTPPKNARTTKRTR
jgi:hypothetical protein